MLYVLHIVVFSYIGISAILNGNISILDTMAYTPNPQILINMSTMYASKDLANILINKRIARMTVVHHVFVFLAYGYVVNVLSDQAKWKGEGFFKSFIAHASFTMFAFPVELYLAMRFFIDRKGVLNAVLKKLTVIHNLVFVIWNFIWQFGYIYYLHNSNQLGGYLTVYLLILLIWSFEEYLVMIHLFKL